MNGLSCMAAVPSSMLSARPRVRPLQHSAEWHIWSRIARGAGETMVTAIVNGTLIDGTGGDPLPGGTILVDGDRIAAVGPGSRVGVPPAAKLFDAAGRTVLPGF